MIITCTSIAELVLVSEKNECSGSEESGCLQASLEDCARACHTRCTMFVYGREGGSRCYGDKCLCYCETSASDEGTCSEIDHPDYNLYKYVEGKIVR